MPKVVEANKPQVPTFTCTQKHLDRLPPSLKPFAEELVKAGRIILEPGSAS